MRKLNVRKKIRGRVRDVFKAANGHLFYKNTQGQYKRVPRVHLEKGRGKNESLRRYSKKRDSKRSSSTSQKRYQLRSRKQWGGNNRRTLRQGLMVGQGDHQYKLVEQIGVGGMSFVWKAKPVTILDKEIIEDDEVVAIKIIRKMDEGVVRRARREASALERLSQYCEAEFRYVICLNDFWETNEFIYIVTAYFPRSLKDMINPNGIKNDKQYIRLIDQLSTAVNFLHGRGMAHQDLKPDNILLDSENGPKLIDFDTVCYHYEGSCEIAGTDYYHSPEMTKLLRTGRATFSQIKANDTWALATIALEARYGIPAIRDIQHMLLSPRSLKSGHGYYEQIPFMLNRFEQLVQSEEKPRSPVYKRLMMFIKVMRAYSQGRR